MDLSLNEEELVNAIHDLVRAIKDQKLDSLYPSIDYAVIRSLATVGEVKNRKGVK